MSSKKAKGKRAKTRDKLKRRRPKPTVNALLKELKESASVEIKIDSSIHAGIPHHRFHGRTGKVKKKQGSSYLVEVSDGNKTKTVLVGAAHLHEVSTKKG
jgi:large subunit ribosomal protein L21e